MGLRKFLFLLINSEHRQAIHHWGVVELCGAKVLHNHQSAQLCQLAGQGFKAGVGLVVLQGFQDILHGLVLLSGVSIAFP